MKIRGKMLAAIAGLMLVGVIIWAVATTPDGPPSTEKIAPPPIMEYEGNELSEEINGVRLWDLTAEKMIIDAGTQNAVMNKLLGHFYQADGRSIEFRADNGVYDYGTKNIHVEGNISIETSDGAKLTSETLDWLSAEELLVAEGDVRITRDDLKATGDRAESADGLKKFWLKGHAHITKGAPDEDAPDDQSEISISDIGNSLEP